MIFTGGSFSVDMATTSGIRVDYGSKSLKYLRAELKKRNAKHELVTR